MMFVQEIDKTVQNIPIVYINNINTARVHNFSTSLGGGVAGREGGSEKMKIS